MTFIKLFFTSLALLFVLYACASHTVRAYELNIYDSPTDKTQDVVEYCNDSGFCHQIVIDDEEIDSKKVQEWIKKLVDLDIKE